jgi:hypothetical protein
MAVLVLSSRSSVLASLLAVLIHVTTGHDHAAGFGDAALAAAVSDGLEDGEAAISLVQNSGRRVLSGRPVIGGAMDDEDPGCVDRAVAGLSQAVDSNIVDMMLAEEMEMSLTQAGVDLEHPTEFHR